MDLFDAQLDGYDLEIETLDDRFEKAITRHEFPFKDGAMLEDMGLKARSVQIRCYFWDDGADHFTYADHVDFLNHLKSKELFELVHPKYGPLTGCVESVSVRHDDREMTAEIDITFVEDRRAELADVAYEDVEAALEEAYLSGVEKQQKQFSDIVTEALGSEASAILAKELDPLLGIVEQFQDVSLKARSFLKEVEYYVSGLEADLTEIANPANSLIATINYGTNLPGRVIGAVARCVERYAILYDSLKTAPCRFVNSLIQGYRKLEGAFERFGTTTKVACASHTAVQVGSLYKADEEVRSQQKRLEGVAGFDALGNYTAPEPLAAVMSVGELEQSLSDTRGYLQEAIDVARDNDSLKAQALSLLTHVNTVKLEREKIMQVELDNPLPLHLVCLKYGLPYSSAERLMSINNIRQPNYTSGQVNVYAG